MTERRPYPGNPRYSVSADGRVFRDVALPKERTGELRQHDSKRGYLRVWFDGRLHNVHQLVARTFLENPEGKPEVAHNDGVKTNNAVSNLRWATRRENSDDMDRHGSRAIGEACPQAKLTEAQVLEIRSATTGKPRRGKPYHRDIAAAYGVTRECVTRIANGDRWKHAAAP